MISTATGPDAGQDSEAMDFSFSEGEQLVQFGIQGNDSYAESEPESEAGMEPEPTTDDQNEERNRERSTRSESTDRSRSPVDQREKRNSQKAKRDQIKQIDDEMASKLYELHGLMTEGGLVESAEILRRSFGVKPDGNTTEQGEQDFNVPGPSMERRTSPERQMTPQQRAEQMIKDAENAKARIMNTPGNSHCKPIDINREFVHSVMVDESYSVIAAHIDEATYDKIIQCKYMDFAKLIPKDKIAERKKMFYN